MDENLFSYKIDENVHLSLLHPHNAEQLFNLVSANHAHISEWMFWLDKPYTPEDARRQIQRNLESLANREGFELGIWVKEILAGCVRFNYIDFKHRSTELGYWVGASFQGQGLATRACRALIEIAFGQLGLNRVEIRCIEENVRSRAAAERLGFAREGVIRQARWRKDHFVNHVVYGMLASEWDSQKTDSSGDESKSAAPASNLPHIAEVAASYNRWAVTYDTDPNRTRELAAAALRQSDLKIVGRDVIEIGCGTGRNTKWLAEQARSVIAMDFSEGMLRQAKARALSPRVKFIQRDIRDGWPLEDASTDLVIAMLVLEHIEQVEPVFAHAARVLRSGGECFVCELHPMRQMQGRQAVFNNSETGERESIQAFLHDVSDYVKAGLEAGFELTRMGEWRDEDDPRTALPRVLSLKFKLAPKPLQN
jgi:RimJ/RimL family protein N-acetyltransferase/ubiquinone/menaquinone biosynthesis C-methylase UbiE